MKDCGKCSLCCKLIETHEPFSEHDEWCYLCTKDSGCSIYDARSNECREYQCMWSQMEVVATELRPDKLHVIFEKISEKTIFALHDSDYKMLSRTLGQIKAFNRQGFTVMMQNGMSKTVYTAEGHNKDAAIFDIQVHLARLEEKMKK